MPAPLNETTAFLLTASSKRFHSFIDDLKPHEFEHQPFPGVNSVAWMLGHLALTDRRILKLFGVDGPPLPDGFDSRFVTTKQPAGEQKGLGDPAELVALYDAHRNLLIETVLAASEEALAKPLPAAPAGAKTLGEVAAFMAVHVGLHAGQISLIRRSLGYPPVV